MLVSIMLAVCVVILFMKQYNLRLEFKRLEARFLETQNPRPKWGTQTPTPTIPTPQEPTATNSTNPDALDEATQKTAFDAEPASTTPPHPHTTPPRAAQDTPPNVVEQTEHTETKADTNTQPSSQDTPSRIEETLPETTPEPTEQPEPITPKKLTGWAGYTMPISPQYAAMMQGRQPQHTDYTQRSNNQHQAASPSAPNTLDTHINTAIAWIINNWLFAAAAGLLALAGVYLVIYGIESGVLTPGVRIIGALMMGAAFVAGGEKLRQVERGGLQTLLPSVFSSAGLVVLYGAVYAAYGLYGLTTIPITFAGLVFVSLSSLVLGGNHRDFFAGFGIFGASITPVILGTPEVSPFLMPIYYGLIVLLSFLVAYHRENPYLSLTALGLSASLASPFLFLLATDANQDILSYGFQLFLLGASLFYIKTHAQAPTLLFNGLQSLEGIGRTTPSLKGGLLLLPVVFISTFMAFFFTNQPQLGLFLMMSLFGAYFLTTYKDHRYGDLGAYGAALLMVLTLFSTFGTGITLPNLILMTLLTSALLVAHSTLPSLDPLKKPLSMLAASVLVLSTLWAYQLLTYHHMPLLWTPNFYWHEQDILLHGTWPWMLLGLAVAAALFALIAAAQHNKEGTGAHTIAAFVILGVAAVTQFGGETLQVALCALLLTSMALYQRYDIAYLALAVSLGIGLLLGRLLIWPGLPWALDATWTALGVAYGITILTFLAIFIMAKKTENLYTTAISALMVLLPATFNIVLYKYMDTTGSFDGTQHWTLVMAAFSILLSGLNLVETDKPTTTMLALKLKLGQVMIVFSILLAAVAVVFYNPILHPGQNIVGILLFNTMLMAYLLPALAILAFLLRSKRVDTLLSQPQQLVFLGLSIFLTLVWVFLNIRFAWHGSIMTLPVVYQGENIAYTLVTVAIGIGVTFGSSFITQRYAGPMRRVGLAFVGAAIGKVLLVDAGDVQGLYRVAVFLIMGLTVAGLAWIDKRMSQNTGDTTEETT